MAAWGWGPKLGACAWENGDQAFYNKLRTQIGNARPKIMQLASEAVWLLLLFVYEQSFGIETKRERISEVWNFSGEPLPNSELLADDCGWQRHQLIQFALSPNNSCRPEREACGRKCCAYTANHMCIKSCNPRRPVPSLASAWCPRSDWGIARNRPRPHRC